MSNQTLSEALRAKATFNIVNSDSINAKKLCLLPGIYSTMKPIVVTTGTGESAKDEVKGISYSDPTNLVNAGYQCDEVADDYNSEDTAIKVQVTGNNRTKYRDFLNTVQRIGIRVSRIIIQNKNASSQDIFDQEISASRTAIGAKPEMRFINLQDYVSVNAYDRTKITIDLTNAPLDLTPDMFLAMNIPASASFSMQFEFEQ